MRQMNNIQSMKPVQNCTGFVFVHCKLLYIFKEVIDQYNKTAVLLQHTIKNTFYVVKKTFKEKCITWYRYLVSPHKSYDMDRLSEGG